LWELQLDSKNRKWTDIALCKLLTIYWYFFSYESNNTGLNMGVKLIVFCHLLSVTILNYDFFINMNRRFQLFTWRVAKKLFYISFFLFQQSGRAMRTFTSNRWTQIFEKDPPSGPPDPAQVQIRTTRTSNRSTLTRIRSKRSSSNRQRKKKQR
jgi:hypothetical protein